MHQDEAETQDQPLDNTQEEEKKKHDASTKDLDQALEELDNALPPSLKDKLPENLPEPASQPAEPRQVPDKDDPKMVWEFFQKEKLSYGDVLASYVDGKKPKEIKIRKIKFGSFRKRTESGIKIIKKSIEDTKGKISDGLIRERQLIVLRLHNDPDGFEYECLDGNHRLTVFKEMNIKSWPCIVIDASLSVQEKFILSHGKYLLLLATPIGVPIF